MKRTKENWLAPIPRSRSGISGMRFFDGEDLQYQERKKSMQATQRRWIDQQRQFENKRKKEEDEEEKAYHQQTMQINRMRGFLEDDLERKKKAMSMSIRDTNLMLSRMKKERERWEKEQKKREEIADLEEQRRIRAVSNYVHLLN
ncbi:unnamed protein product [Blepharisma stoltei]|uniref:Uncharacterized protein n=1 Tax=Blepharisma stoltei TaxID=1481888 RepID=A0AAU9JR53_9CILI|nr:unnamed protein product [Blepharisma stoltei]